MKTRIRNFAAAAAVLALTASLNGQEPAPAEKPAVTTNEISAATSAREARRAERRAARQATRQQQRAETRTQAAASAPVTVTAPVAAETKPASNDPKTTAPENKPLIAESKTPPVDNKSAAEPDRPLRLNFRGVSLDMVLNYLSEAAGFTIVLETPVKGTVDVWSNQPLTKPEAVDLLNTVLNKNGYAALQNGRTLTIVSKEDAKRRDIPIKIGSAFRDIPKNDELVTQVIPVKNINVTQLARDLAPLIPTSSSIVPNEGGNALLMTDTQANIHRVAEIVAALDGQVSASASIRVFPLRYADAKALATTLRDLFQDTSTGGRNQGGRGGGGQGGGPGGFAAAIFGGGGGGDRGGGGGGGRGGASGANTVATAAKVTAVADEHSNSLIISASDSQFAAIEQLIKSVDTDVQDLTELRVFHLKNADPTETSDLLTSLFPDTTRQNDNTRGGGVQFGGAFGGGGFRGIGGAGGQGRGQGRGQTTASTERSLKQSRVISVPDPRTGSIIVSAAKELMPQIAEMVLQLDTDPAKKKKVTVYNLENANVQEVETVLRGLFESQNSRSTASSQNNALQNRANQTMQQQTGNQAGGGGFGGGGGGGLGGGGGR